MTYNKIINEKACRAHDIKLGREVLRDFEYNNNLYHFLPIDMGRSSGINLDSKNKKRA
jgi:hypothetical protein